MDWRSGRYRPVRQPRSPQRQVPFRAGPAMLAPPEPASNPTAPPQYAVLDGRVTPSPSRRPPCNPPTRCGAPVARISIQPTSNDASTSTSADCSDGHGAAGTRSVADGPDADCARPPDARVTRSRIASWAGSGTHTGVSSLARCSRARLTASRRSVLIRSPGLRGISDGATTTQPCPAGVN